MILRRTKTETRRPAWKATTTGALTRTVVGRRPAKPGAIRGFYTRPAFVKPNPGTPFCTALILTVHAEAVGDIDAAGAIAEGYPDVAEFCGVWERIWGEGSWSVHKSRQVYVVRFEVVEQLACVKCGETPKIEGQLRSFAGSVELYCIHCFGPGCLGH